MTIEFAYRIENPLKPFRFAVSDDGVTITNSLVPEDKQLIQRIIVGPPGLPGAAGASFDFTQASPSTLWTIAHNLGFYPEVQLMTTGRVVFEANITHASVNLLYVNLNSPIAGFARCN